MRLLGNARKYLEKKENLVIYYSTVRQTLISIRRFFENKGRLLLPVLFLALFLFPMSAKAQESITNNYTNYINLFSGKNPPPSLSLKSIFKQGSTTDLDVSFQFQSSFNLSNGGTNPLDWHWNHIRDFDNSDYVFIIRICNTSDSDENSCLFSTVPYKSLTSKDQDIFCKNNVCTLPKGGSPWPKIYHYTATENGRYLSYSNIQNDKFNVLFNVSELYSLTDNGLDSKNQLNDVFKIGNTNNYKADVWYCAGEVRGEDLPSDEPSNNIRQFKNLCDDNRPYFKIVESKEFAIPRTIEEAGNQDFTPIEQVDTTANGNSGVLPECSITPVGDGSVMGCVAQILYHGVFRPVAFFAQLMGKLFDFFIGYSLSDESYRHPFIQTGWQLVRDISNIFFIIIMIYSGLAAVFSTSNVSYKKVIPTLIINALIINFSLFATRLVIDMSNITARIFYNQMVVKVGEEVRDGQNSDSGYKPISEAIVSSFNPQKIFKGSVLTDDDPSADDEGSFNAQVSYTNKSSKWHTYSKEYAAYFALVTLVAIAISFSMAMMFWKTAFLFVGRVIGLYVAMIFSPFAFLSRGGVPLVSKLPTLNYGAWWKDLTNYALLAPIFVFFLYIINSFLNVEFFNKVGLDQNGQGFFGSVMYVMIPMLIIYGLVTRGVSIANNLAGEFGKMAQNFATKATGFVGGAALGVTAIGGSRIIGGAAKKIDESRFGAWIRNKAPDSKIARNLQKGLNATRTGSFDLRQTSVGSNLFKKMDLNTNQKGLNTLSGFGLGLGTDQRKGGFDADVKRRQENQERKQKLLEEKMSDEQIKEYNKRKQDEREAKIDKIIMDRLEEKYDKKTIKNWKENDKIRLDNEKSYIKSEDKIKDSINKIPPAKEMRSVADMNKDRRKQYADNLKKPSIIDKTLSKLPIVGAALGSNVRMTADKKAAKKIEENGKVEKELAEIEATLKKGFQDLIAIDMFQSSPSFTNKITEQERQEIIKFGTIQSGGRKGQGMYDILEDQEKKIVDSELKEKKAAMSSGSDEDKKKAKEEYEELEDLIKSREANKYDLKSLRTKLKDLKQEWVNNPTSEDARNKFREHLKEIKIAEKHQDKWRDLNNYIKTRRDKLKGEEKK